MCKFGFVPVDNVCLPTPRAIVDDPRIGVQIYPQKTSRNHHAAPPKSDKVGNPFQASSKRPQRALPGEFCDKKTRICVGQSHCVHSFCKCPDGTKNNGQRCTIIPKIKRPMSSRRRAPTVSPRLIGPQRTTEIPKKLIETSEFKRLLEDETFPNNETTGPSTRNQRREHPIEDVRFSTMPSVNNADAGNKGHTPPSPPYIEIGRPETAFEGDRRFAATLLDNIRRAAKSVRLAQPTQQKYYGLPFDSCELNDDCVDGAKCAKKAGRS